MLAVIKFRIFYVLSKKNIIILNSILCLVAVYGEETWSDLITSIKVIWKQSAERNVDVERAYQKYEETYILRKS
jgi:hypothetical protein